MQEQIIKKIDLLIDQWQSDTRASKMTPIGEEILKLIQDITDPNSDKLHPLINKIFNKEYYVTKSISKHEINQFIHNDHLTQVNKLRFIFVLASANPIDQPELHALIDLICSSEQTQQCRKFLLHLIVYNWIRENRCIDQKYLDKIHGIMTAGGYTIPANFILNDYRINNQSLSEYLADQPYHIIHSWEYFFQQHRDKSNLIVINITFMNFIVQYRRHDIYECLDQIISTGHQENGDFQSYQIAVIKHLAIKASIKIAMVLRHPHLMSNPTNINHLLLLPCDLLHFFLFDASSNFLAKYNGLPTIKDTPWNFFKKHLFLKNKVKTFNLSIPRWDLLDAVRNPDLKNDFFKTRHRPIEQRAFDVSVKFLAKAVSTWTELSQYLDPNGLHYKFNLATILQHLPEEQRPTYYFANYDALNKNAIFFTTIPNILTLGIDNIFSSLFFKRSETNTMLRTKLIPIIYAIPDNLKLDWLNFEMNNKAVLLALKPLTKFLKNIKTLTENFDIPTTQKLFATHLLFKSLLSKDSTDKVNQLLRKHPNIETLSSLEQKLNEALNQEPKQKTANSNRTPKNQTRQRSLKKKKSPRVSKPVNRFTYTQAKRSFISPVKKSTSVEKTIKKRNHGQSRTSTPLIKVKATMRQYMIVPQKNSDNRFNLFQLDMKKSDKEDVLQHVRRTFKLS